MKKKKRKRKLKKGICGGKKSNKYSNADVSRSHFFPIYPFDRDHKTGII
jgi:hypothetical protein